jgi:hypothetical protein
MANLGIFVTNANNMAHVMVTLTTWRMSWGLPRRPRPKGQMLRSSSPGKEHCLQRIPSSQNFAVLQMWQSKDPQFSELCSIADVAICADSYKKMGYDPENDIPEGLTEVNPGQARIHH